jgi:mono/diheme cytochrome c family protein
VSAQWGCVSMRLIGLLWAFGLSLTAAQTRTLDDGVFTSEQSARGKAHYDAFCASCHVSDLSGTLAADAGAPPLRGAPFIAALEKKGAAAVFDYVKTTMPSDDPASLKDAEYLDILAYVIQANGYPAGGRELTLADLPQIFGRRRPSSP